MKQVPVFKFGSAVAYSADHCGKSVHLPFMTDDLFISCDSLHQMLPWMTSSMWILNSSGKCFLGKWVNISYICCDSTVHRLYFSKSSKTVTSDVFHERWEARFHCSVVQEL